MPKTRYALRDNAAISPTSNGEACRNTTAVMLNAKVVTWLPMSPAKFASHNRRKLGFFNTDGDARPGSSGSLAASTEDMCPLYRDSDNLSAVVRDRLPLRSSRGNSDRKGHVSQHKRMPDQDIYQSKSSPSSETNRGDFRSVSSSRFRNCLAAVLGDLLAPGRPLLVESDPG